MKKTKRFLLVLISLLFAVMCAVPQAYAGGALTAGDLQLSDTVPAWELTELVSNIETYEPIPLLCIRISYDANGNGKDDFDPSQPKKLTDLESEYYGEQWCYSSDTYWSNMLFGKTGKTLYNFYRINSNEKFWFTPAQENFGSTDDGVVHVIIKSKHPNATTPSDYTSDNSSRLLAIQAASDYVDFTQFDKDGNGIVSRTELAVIFVCGGYEYSSWKGSTKMAFGTHAHYTSGSGTKTDGVSVLHGTGYVRIGEYVGTSSCNPVGTVAHELCHYLGEPDLYDTGKNSNSKWTPLTGTMSLMSSGSHNAGGGEAGGTSPSNIDAYLSCDLGFVNSETVIDGEYTLYSRQSSKGEYNVLKINTPNPQEYYLVENRYSKASPDYFDALSDGQKGIVIWHIDEQSVSSNMNKYSTYVDPAIVIMAPTGISSTNCAFRVIPGAEGSAKKNMFVPCDVKYMFPVSMTPYTLLTETEAAGYQMWIEILSERGNEMTVRVNGGSKLAPSVSGLVTEATTDTITLSGRINDLNGGNATECGFIISTKANPTTENGTVIYAKPDEYGKFNATFDGLKAGLKYFCVAFVSGEFGTGSASFNGYTNSVPVVHDYSTVRIYRGVTEVERSYDVKLYPGNALKYNFPMEKRGYTFCGWFYDSAYTKKYDMSTIQNEVKDFTIYARWTEDTRSATLVLSGGKALYTVFPTVVGDTFVQPVLAEKTGYTFGGYYKDASFTTIFDFETPIEEAGDVTVYVKWIADEGTETPETTAQPETTVLPETTAAPETTSSPETSGDTTVLPETTGANETTDISETTGNTPEGSGKIKFLYVGIACVIVIAVAVVANRIAVKKKKNGNE